MGPYLAGVHASPVPLSYAHLQGADMCGLSKARRFVQMRIAPPSCSNHGIIGGGVPAAEHPSHIIFSWRAVLFSLRPRRRAVRPARDGHQEDGQMLVGKIISDHG